MTVVTALFVDAYRQLNAKKLFWITLLISGVVVLVYASIGFNEQGMSMFFGLTQIDNEFITKDSPIARLLYRSIFTSFIVALWLAWIATILALISTTTIFPDFLAEGAVDIVLAKPIRRSSLFIIKYLSSLLFVLLQVSLFCIGIFICMGWRLGDWNWLIFAAIPVVTVFYSYLYAVNVLIGVVTRSALTALLVTMLFWFSLFGINLAEGILNQFTTQFEVQMEDMAANTAGLETRLEVTETDSLDEDARQRLLDQIDKSREDRDELQGTFDRVEAWHRRIRLLQTVMPKTSETIGLLDRWLREPGDVNLIDVLSGNLAVDDEGNFVPERTGGDREIQMRMQEEIESRSVWYVIGTSLVFEAVILLIAGAVFVRRDF
ncbi:MAG: hypothetical protein ACYTJ0_07110 [Planctomycetota bacterium]|jgi:ABC-type transport system involved in multi-copper enzyme maturation permease subunit